MKAVSFLRVGDAGPTAAQAAVGGQLQGPLRAVPAVPRKLVLALLDAALSSCGHAAGVDQVGLQEQQQTEDMLEPRDAPEASGDGRNIEQCT